MSTPAELALASVSAANAAMLDLIEFLRFPTNDLTITDCVENMADACKLAIEASSRDDDDAMQLSAALTRFLEGWAG